MQRQQAPFRADIVGSFLRPDSIKQARQQLAEGIIDAAQLREIENNAIRHLVQQQCDCGLHVVTDGEFRRAWWHFDFFDGLQGVERYDAEQGIQLMNYHGGQLTRPPLRRQHATSTGPVPRRHRRQFFAPGQHQTGASAAG
ncbi:hypothetical protein AAHC57_08200 [Klebsiella quasipneumoniae subsp. similipneumoniae]|uniref:hypothetical protein n=1 Tax=Klebsiella quasipneumoniae TaxID=1463165 RepID=UPI003967C9D2